MPTSQISLIADGASTEWGFHFQFTNECLALVEGTSSNRSVNDEQILSWVEGESGNVNAGSGVRVRSGLGAEQLLLRLVLYTARRLVLPAAVRKQGSIMQEVAHAPCE